MKFPRWLPYVGIVAFYITLAVLVRIWVSPLYLERRDSERLPAMRRWAAAMERVVYENEKLRAVVVRDSVLEMIPRTPGVHLLGVGDTVNTLETMRGAETAPRKVSLRAIAVREAGENPRASVSVITVPVGYGGHPEVREGVWRRMFFAGIEQGAPYCVVAVPTLGNQMRPHEGALITRGGMLGQCAFWSRYGIPGKQILHWLNNGGAHFAGSDYVSGSWDNADRLEHPELVSPGQRRFMLPLAGQACLGGRADVCARAVADPQTIYGWPGVAPRATEWDTRIAPGERTLLVKLERDFGAERFERFWTSDEPFEKAFQEAFGVELGAWVRDSIRPIGEISRGARIGGTSVILTLLFLGACLGAALATAHRRRV